MTGLVFALMCVRHAERLKQEALRLRRWHEITGHLSLLLQQGTMSLPEVLRLCADATTPADSILTALADAMIQQPLAGCAALCETLLEPCREKDVLLRLFARLSRGTPEERSLAAQQAGAELRLMADSAADKSAVDARLWQRLGVIGGACVTLLLL